MKLCEVYSINIKSITLIFDGNELSDDSSPLDDELEDDDLIDVKVIFYVMNYSAKLKREIIDSRRVIHCECFGGREYSCLMRLSV